MTNYLVFDTEKEAIDRSRLAWEEKLGRKKNPNDVTEFMWSWTSNSKDGRAALVVMDETDKLSSQESAKVQTTLDGWF